jgi:predicted Ser/Thr protein kinase
VKIRASVSDQRWRYLAAALDARYLLVIFFVFILSMPDSDNFGNQKIDVLLFKFGALIQRQTVDTRGYIRVDVPPDEMQRFLHDPVSARSMMLFLGQLQQSYTKGSALVLHEKLWTVYSANELILDQGHSLSSGVSVDVGQSITDMTSSMRIFQSILASDRLIRTRLEAGSGFEKNVIQLVRQRLPGAVGNDFFYRPSTANYSVDVPQMRTGLLERPLLWKGELGVQPDARLSLFLRQQELHSPDWLPGKGIKLRDTILPTAINSTILPVFSADTNYLPDVVHYQLSSLSGQDARRIMHEKTVVIGLAGDKETDDLLYSVLSLETGNFAVPAPWFLWLHFVVMALFLVFLLSLPYMRIKVGAVVSVFLCLALLLAQQIFLIWHREWFPISQWILFIAVGHLWIFLWSVRRSFYSAGDVVEDDHGETDFQFTSTIAKKISTGFWGKAKKAVSTRISPTLSEKNHDHDDLDDFDTLQKTVPLKSSSPPISSGKSKGLRRNLGRYQVKSELGRGAMGVVYLGFDPNISREVAIKTLHYDQFERSELPAVKERFLREAAAAGRLRHPNIVTIYDAGEDEDLAYIAMDYVKGDSLSSRTSKGNLLDPEMVYWIMAQVAYAVDEANSQGIIHRDIKPSNILFDDNANVVKVADFGIARIMDGSSTRTKTGDILGSPLYMSPEQIKGEQVSGKSDIFSIGVTFYQLLTGELPFKGDNLANLSYQIVQCKYKPVQEIRQDLPESARRIITKALQKNPENRYASAGEMGDAFLRAYEKDFS